MANPSNTVGAKAVPVRQAHTPIGAIHALTATSTGNGTIFDIGAAHRSFTCQALLVRASTASPTSAGVVLQGSLNGTNFHDLGNKTTATTSCVMFDSTSNHAVTFIRVQASSKAAGAGAWTLYAWLGVNE